eukprot:932642-Amphidinium_carterae.1
MLRETSTSVLVPNVSVSKTKSQISILLPNHGIAFPLDFVVWGVGAGEDGEKALVVDGVKLAKWHGYGSSRGYSHSRV